MSAARWRLEETQKSFRVIDGKRIYPVDLIPQQGSTAASVSYDAWSVRTAFLSLASDMDFLRFLDQTGFFSLQFKSVWTTEKMRQWQEIIRRMLNKAPSDWKAQILALPGDTRQHIVALKYHTEFHVKFDWKGSAHYAVFVARDTLTAILLTVYLDHLRGAKFGFCKRPDCRRPFEVISRHKRIYCGQYCAHLESLRRMRIRQKHKRKTRREDE